MKLTVRDAIATVLVAAVVVPYAGYLAWGSMPFIQDPEMMAAVALVFGLFAAAYGGWVVWSSGLALRLATTGLAVVSLGLGAMTLVSMDFLSTITREWLLAGFVATIVALWAVAILRHAGIVHTATEPRAGPATA
jgi:hypothetical protein